MRFIVAESPDLASANGAGQGERVSFPGYWSTDPSGSGDRSLARVPGSDI